MVSARRLLLMFATLAAAGIAACTEPAPIEGAACNAAHICPGGFGCAGGACRKLIGGPIERCVDDTGCPLGRCLVSTGFCVQCLGPSDCVQSTCLPDLYQCGCQDNDDCATRRCNIATATCLSCYADAQCDSGACNRDTGVCDELSGPVGSGTDDDAGRTPP